MGDVLGPRVLFLRIPKFTPASYYKKHKSPLEEAAIRQLSPVMVFNIYSSYVQLWSHHANPGDIMKTRN
jgi:hypothetical protein